MAQMELWSNGNKRQMFTPDVPIDHVIVSPLNPRQTRTDEHIKDIADLIVQNGFDQTCAPKAYRNNGCYEVFAGGNRLLAAQKAGCVSIPLYVYEGYEEAELWKLAYLDNDQAGKHNEVSCVDIWMDYQRRKAAGWSQNEIADALGVSQTLVSFRLRLAALSPAILDYFITTNGLNERHAREIVDLLPGNNLDPWLTRDAAMLEVIETVIKRTVAPTAKHFAEEVEKFNATIAHAQDCLGKLDEQWHEQFIQLLAKKKARSTAQVDAHYNTIAKLQADDARRQTEAAELAARKATEEEQRKVRESYLVEQRNYYLSKLVHGDARKVHIPLNIKLLFTDPPYGKDYQSNRRVVTSQADKIENDNEAAFDLLADVLGRFYPRMAEDSFALVWCDWRHQCRFADIITGAGFEIRAEVIWNKPNHGSGDIYGAPAPKHEKFFFAVKGNPKLTEGKRFDSVLDGSKFLGSGHPTEKPTDLIAMVIESLTLEGDVVADPFMGSGSVPLTAFRLQRDFWGCDLSEQWHKFAGEQLFNLVKAQVK